MYLTGGFLQAMFSLACGLSTSGTQLIVFRGLAGVAYSFCMPSAVSLLNHSFPPGQFRNWGFAAMGSGQPIGYGLGMTLGGVFGGMSSAGWRTGFYVVAVVDFAVFIMAIWQLPKDKQVPCRSVILQRLRDEIDWVGIVIVSVALALLSYFLA
jgi:MFS family permease